MEVSDYNLKKRRIEEMLSGAFSLIKGPDDFEDGIKALGQIGDAVDQNANHMLDLAAHIAADHIKGMELECEQRWRVNEAFENAFGRFIHEALEIKTA